MSTTDRDLVIHAAEAGAAELLSIMDRDPGDVVLPLPAHPSPPSTGEDAGRTQR